MDFIYYYKIKNEVNTKCAINFYIIQMAIICVGDLHIQKRNLNIFKEFREKFISFVKTQRDIDTIVILGDILHTMNIVNIQCLNVAVEFFKELDNLDIKIMIIVGNHDYIGPNEYLSKNHWMNVVSLFNPHNITIVDNIVRYNDNLYLPYVPDGKFVQTLENVDLTNIKYIFCHQEFLGSVYEFGNIISENGEEWNNNHSTDTIIVSGHIHKKQWVNKNIYYTGTPYQTRFNESPDKTISLIRDGNITEIDLDLPKMITIYTAMKDVDNLNIVFKSNNLYKIVILVENIEQSRSFVKSQRYKKLKSSVTIIFEYPKNSIVNIPSPNDTPPNFKQILFDKIRHNANMKTLFDKVM